MQSKDLLFPIEQTLSPDYLRDNFWKCNFTSVKEPLQYWILLPNTVKPVNLKKVKHPNLKLNVWGQYCIVENKPYLEVQMLQEYIHYELNPADWLLKKLALMGETVMHLREIQGKSTGVYLDVLTHKKWLGGEDIISRFTVLKDSGTGQSGANILCAKASCLYDDYNAYALQILQIVGNWDFINKTEWQLAEPLYPFKYDFIEPVTFYVPASWDIKFEVEEDKALPHFLFTHDVLGDNKGLINAYFYPLHYAQNADELLKKNFERLANLNPNIPALKETDTSNPFITAFYGATGSLKYEEESDEAYLFIYIIKTKRGWYYFEQMGPQPNLQNDFWEVNKRTIELIRDSFNNPDFKQKEYANVQAIQSQFSEVVPVEKKSWLIPNWHSGE